MTTIDLGESDVLMLEAVTVESVREGQSRAINQQRTSNTIMNVISSDAIGNLPDNTVGEALARFREDGLYTFVRWNTFFTNPPLTITEEEMAEGFAIIDRALEITDAAVV